MPTSSLVVDSVERKPTPNSPDVVKALPPPAAAGVRGRIDQADVTGPAGHEGSDSANRHGQRRRHAAADADPAGLGSPGRWVGGRAEMDRDGALRSRRQSVRLHDEHGSAADRDRHAASDAADVPDRAVPDEDARRDSRRVRLRALGAKAQTDESRSVEPHALYRGSRGEHRRSEKPKSGPVAADHLPEHDDGAVRGTVAEPGQRLRSRAGTRCDRARGRLDVHGQLQPDRPRAGRRRARRRRRTGRREVRRFPRRNRPVRSHCPRRSIVSLA